MLVPFVLPFQITFCSLAVLVIVATLLAPKFHRSRKLVFGVSLVFAIVVFIPCFEVVMAVVNDVRYGIFEYADTSVIDDNYLTKKLPSSAKSITASKSPGGFRAKFAVDQASLDAWFDEEWKQAESWSKTKREEPQLVNFDYEQFIFDGLGWPALNTPLKYKGPVNARGGGFTIWYSPSEGVGYERVNYW